MRNFKILILVFSTFLFSCDYIIPEFSIENIEGCYQYDAADYSDMICFTDDNNFIQTRSKNGALEKHFEGEWSLNKVSADHDYSVTLSKMAVISNVRTGITEVKNYVYIRPRKTLSDTIYFPIFDDNRIELNYYKLDK